MLKNLPLKGYIYFALALNILTILFIVLSQHILPPLVPLFYGLPSGSGELVPAIELIVAPLASFFITIVNIIIALRISDAFTKKALAAASCLMTFLSIITVVKIIFLVGFW